MTFWQDKPLAEFSDVEWESVCDGCAKCCLIKFQDETTQVVRYTNVVCKWLDLETCRCTDYGRRHQLVKECIKFSAGDVKDMSWLPISCGYRRLAEGRGLAYWHPLVSGNRESVHEAGKSIQGRVISEEHVHPDEIEACAIKWVERE